MTPIELKEEKETTLREYKALKTLFGDLLLESNGAASPEDVAYYTRKFREAQQKIGR